MTEGSAQYVSLIDALCAYCERSHERIIMTCSCVLGTLVSFFTT